MKLKIKREQAKLLGYPVLKQFGVDDYDFPDRITTIDLAEHHMDKIKTFLKIIEAQKEKKKFWYIRSVITKFISVMEGSKEDKMTGLELFKVALIKYLEKEEGHLIYMKHDSNIDEALCYRITRITYTPPSMYRPAETSMKLIFRQFGSIHTTEISWKHEQVHGKTIGQILMKSGVFLRTDDLRKNYVEATKKFYVMSKEIGIQYIANGIGDDDTLDKEDDEEEEERGYYRWKETRDFKLVESKVVIDVFLESEQSKQSDKETDIGETFWSDPLAKELSDYEDDESPPENYETEIEIPVHPYLVIFDLQRHKRLVTHYTSLKKYKYDEKLSEKLILPKNIKELIQALIEHKEGGFADIIQGKTGGVIILLSGRAGTGKTLTAEVYAESKKKALYNVQASQLGIKPKLLEYRLMKVLRRASRWDAILLIDEADVYVRERGNDLIQNAIVGVFLRILEYHSSMLFMTTNRPDTVDDAIMSRCIARIDYEYPSKEDQEKIWRVLADTAKIKLGDEVIKRFVEKHNEYSGRDIKNLLKLGNLKSIGEKKEITYEILDYVTKFNPTLVKKK
jgi:DNA polymerase III delta prime subunit